MKRNISKTVNEEVNRLSRDSSFIERVDALENFEQRYPPSRESNTHLMPIDKRFNFKSNFNNKSNH